MQNGTKSKRMASTSPRQTNTFVKFHLQDVAAIFQVSKTGCKKKLHSTYKYKGYPIHHLWNPIISEFMGKTFQAAHKTPPNSDIICGQNVGTKVVCGMIFFFKRKAMLKI